MCSNRDLVEINCIEKHKGFYNNVGAFVFSGTSWKIRLGGLLFHSITAIVYYNNRNPKDMIPFIILHVINNFPCGIVRAVDFSLSTYVWISRRGMVLC